jgi:plasmid stabilization system protein ParE
MRIIWARPARNDLFEIADYYRDIAPHFIDAVADRVEAAAIPLLANPYIGPEIGDTRVRRWNVRGTPFLLIYAVRGREIEIRRVRHGASKWRDA